ncbi:extracellular solute-binding protein [bacterium]|nr:extracellular solute-binding protein [bacterium]
MDSVRKNLSRSVFLVLSLFITAVIIVFFLVVPYTEYTSDNDPAVKVYYVDNISEAHQRIIDRFNALYAGRIEVVPINLPFSKFSTNDRKELLARSLRSKSNRIDLFAVDVIWVPRFSRWSQPLDDYFTLQERSELIEHVTQSCYYQQQFYAIPLYTDISIMYYREDIIRTLPDAEKVIAGIEHSLTWKEFITLNARLKQRGHNNPFYIFPADHFEGLTCSFFEGIAPIADRVFFEDSVSVQFPQVRRSIQMLVDMVQTYGMTPRDVLKFDEYTGYQYALRHDAVFVRGWPGFLTQYNTIMEDSEKMRYLRIAPLPHFAGSPKSFVFGGWNLMISKYSEKKEEALAFIRFALQEDNQKLLYDEGGYLPASSRVYADSAYMAGHTGLQTFAELLNSGVYRPTLENYTRISDVFSYNLSAAIDGKISVDEALKAIQYAINTNSSLLHP